MAIQLLPTPTTVEGTGPGSHGTGGDNLRTVREQLLPTPRATDGTKGGPNQRGSSGDLMLPSAVQKMLPTPVVTDAAGSARHTTTTGVAHPGTSLTDATRLLPTPNAGDAKQGYVSAEDHAVRKAAKAAQGIHLQDDLPQVVTTMQDWREYEAAIRRQEAAFGRPAPLPTEPGAKGQPRLSPRFVEWLMGLPEGHVTDPAIGISRNEQLKALGNGVVPQQAAAALRAFIHDTTQERAS